MTTSPKTVSYSMMSVNVDGHGGNALTRGRKAVDLWLCQPFARGVVPFRGASFVKGPIGGAWAQAVLCLI